ncbi:mechanosensitive ion channel family protein [Synechococcus sp. PCC 6312]|uniref:mechanosensitive ion channel family protein n=1 Tax=Synechococcus sp. (strain ATCC 27167 / PCC 6312) TaxID=195253 RepID=UPI00029F213D|nr:mechanosensitive ion channel domain-containing protein [Synechococcus sp. PCC 6312]AFY61749.1 small-conductance mechanosensitive channel [Synechococcus sp. PCC 6312]
MKARQLQWWSRFIGLGLGLLLAVSLSLFWPALAQSPTPTVSPTSPTYYVTLDGQELFPIRERISSFTPEQRTKIISERLKQLAEDVRLELDQFRTVDNPKGGFTDIMAGDTIIFSVFDTDTQGLGLSRQELANSHLETIKTAVSNYRESHRPSSILFGAFLTVITTIITVFIFKVFNKIRTPLQEKLQAWERSHIPPLRLFDTEILTADRVADGLDELFKLVSLFLILLISYTYVHLVLSYFPWTRQISASLLENIQVAVSTLWQDFANYIPNLIFVGFIILVTFYTLRFTRFIFTEIDRGNITFPGFYQEWSKPTYNIVRALIIAFAAIIAFPYLPGSGSPAFQGVSVFLGLLLSLGSSGAVSNIVGGAILTYTRAFKVGDVVKIGEAQGQITEQTLLVTRIYTPKNLTITIPNATVVSSQIINFSAAGQDATRQPLILSTTITLGYDTPWKKVYEAMIDAALGTQNILKEPAPFVWQTSLNDFHVSYEINAYTDRPERMPWILAELHQNLQDYCNQVGIEIMSPNFHAMRDGNRTTIPENYLPADYQPPGFKIESESKSS